MTLHAPLEIELRTNNAVAITRGPLNYAVQLSYNTTSAPGLRFDIGILTSIDLLTFFIYRSAQALSDVEQLYPNAPPQYFTPVSAALLPSKVFFDRGCWNHRRIITPATTLFFPQPNGASLSIPAPLKWTIYRKKLDLYRITLGLQMHNPSRWPPPLAKLNGGWPPGRLLHPLLVPMCVLEIRSRLSWFLLRVLSWGWVRFLLCIPDDLQQCFYKWIQRIHYLISRLSRPWDFPLIRYNFVLWFGSLTGIDVGLPSFMSVCWFSACHSGNIMNELHKFWHTTILPVDIVIGQ